MENSLETQMIEIMAQPGVTGVLCTDKQGLALAAHGTLKPEAGGIVSSLASKAEQLKSIQNASDNPTVEVKFETGSILIRSHNAATLAVHKV